jgi:hypothetical protein
VLLGRAAVLDRGLVQRLAITCAGNWTAETEAQVVEETGALGPRTPAGVR